eukprot:337486-Chlamydomonas_euryale.AAC.1
MAGGDASGKGKGSRADGRRQAAEGRLAAAAAKGRRQADGRQEEAAPAAVNKVRAAGRWQTEGGLAACTNAGSNPARRPAMRMGKPCVLVHSQICVEPRPGLCGASPMFVWSLTQVCVEPHVAFLAWVAVKTLQLSRVRGRHGLRVARTWHGMARRGKCGVASVAWHGMVWRGVTDVAWHGLAWHGLAGRGVAGCGVAG